MCCTQVAETKLVKHNHQDRCMLEMRLGHHEPLVRGFVVYLAQPSSLDMLVLVGKVSCAAWFAVQ